jgi:hypothetical protein
MLKRLEMKITYRVAQDRSATERRFLQVPNPNLVMEYSN